MLFTILMLTLVATLAGYLFGAWSGMECITPFLFQFIANVFIIQTLEQSHLGSGDVQAILLAVFTVETIAFFQGLLSE